MRIVRRAALGAGLWVLLASRLAAAGEGFNPFVFIHAGDPELRKPDVKSTAERFALLAQRANAIGAELVVVAGDLTRNGADEELEAFQDCLKLFKMPVKLVPGNHDAPRWFEKHFGPRRYVFTHNNCDFICLDSNDFMAHPDRDDPKGQELWKWLEAALEDAQRQKRTHTFLVMHHTLAARPPMDAVLAKHRIAAVLCGHEHTTRELPGKGFTIYVSPGTARFRDDKGLGYRLFKVLEDRIEQEAVPLEKEVGRVVPGTPPR
ncbi:MAG TPA: metallophosphoesterase [Planctomycetota bacterium]|nr:metallophosphoesterase [Planctomycetota bacterium]